MGGGGIWLVGLNGRGRRAFESSRASFGMTQLAAPFYIKANISNFCKCFAMFCNVLKIDTINWLL